MSKAPIQSALRIGLAGLGTVGSAVAIALRDGRIPGAELRRVVVRDLSKTRSINLDGVDLDTNPLSLVEADDIDVVVELMGGTDDPALNLVVQALQAGKPVVTANKAMLSAHAQKLTELSERFGQPLAYEAAVAGGIPIIKTLRESLAGNRVTRVSGILNGTCNYILTQMADTGDAFEAILEKAQALGYAEADPEFDVEGIDAAQKLSLLASLAFGVTPNIELVEYSGISSILPRDIRAAKEFGCQIRLIAVAEEKAEGVSLWVGPALLRNGHPLSTIRGVTNAVVISADPVGELMLQGPGAGGGATASAVLGDIADIVGGFGRMFGGDERRSARQVMNTGRVGQCEWYLRLMLKDTSGSMAHVTNVLAQHDVSIGEIIQRAPSDGESHLPVVFITHDCSESVMRAALEQVTALEHVSETVLCLPVFNA